jgi:hypothetical protein
VENNNMGKLWKICEKNIVGKMWKKILWIKCGKNVEKNTVNKVWKKCGKEYCE